MEKTSKLGIKDEDIINELVKVGWDKKTIDKAYKRYKERQ